MCKSKAVVWLGLMNSPPSRRFKSTREATMTTSTSMLQSLSIGSVIRGHHIYKDIWTPFIEEQLDLQRELNNAYDRYAVTIIKKDKIVGRVSRELTRQFSRFLLEGGSIVCAITGKGRKGNGLEVSCRYELTGSPTSVKKLAKSCKN